MSLKDSLLNEIKYVDLSDEILEFIAEKYNSTRIIVGKEIYKLLTIKHGNILDNIEYIGTEYDMDSILIGRFAQNPDYIPSLSELHTIDDNKEHEHNEHDEHDEHDEIDPRDKMDAEDYINDYISNDHAFFGACSWGGMKIIKFMVMNGVSKEIMATGIRSAVIWEQYDVLIYLINLGADNIHEYYNYNNKNHKHKIWELLNRGLNISKLANIKGIEQLQEDIKKLHVTTSVELYNYLPKDLVYIVMEYCL